ncbi:alpha/beta fold hydrolase [Cryobacterium tagatosivorans]|uniref:Alpha/beta hydrolase n=1 Tax=Cryobacterium tagatosivorans TaxID=1259199 RepID=A0A4R8U9R0_9MICO|nr:alpha/beta hydrolase [Cryobacterium tagatosivorans]TFB46315.1 alpha/beta hydrolase [Cryobacterium tagatosivorans]
MAIRERRRDNHRDQLEALDRAIGDLDWTVPPPGTTSFGFPAPSGILAATALGDPAHPRVVLLPGATGSKEDFVLLAPLLRDAGYFVESYDLAGQYQSAEAGPGEDGRYDYALFVADLIAFLEAGSTPVHVLGYSFAGVVAELALAERPELFATLTLLGAPPEPGQAFRGVRWIGKLSYLLPAHRIASLTIWGIVTNKNKVRSGRLALVRMRFQYTSRRSFDDIVRLMKHTPDVRAVLATAGIPILIAVGDNDLWRHSLHRGLADRIGAELRVYRTGHSPCETTPHQLARDMLALYARGATR